MSAEQRAERLQRIVEGYEVYEDGMPDSTVPGAGKVVRTELGSVIHHPRFALVTQYAPNGNYRLRLGEDLRNIEQLAADAATDAEGGEEPICYFDLDQLAGEEPHLGEGDVVLHDGRQYQVERVDEELIEGEVGHYLCLIDPGRESESWDDYDERAHEDEVGIVERVEPDERMPVRYLLAKLTTVVAFNSTPEGP